MKLGIVSLYGNENYGNKLQSYAVNRKLLSIGFFDTVITIKNKHQFKKTFKDRKSQSKLAENIHLNRLLQKYRKVYFLFFDKNIYSSRKTYWCNNGVVKLAKTDRCDLYCAGSDQVWNPTIGRSGMLNYLGFAEKDRTFSYVASFGIDHIPEEYVEDVRKGLEHVKFISVREDAGKRIVEELTGRTDVYVHVDPTMLLTAEEWDKVSKKSKHRIPEKYILTYFLGSVSEERKTVLRNFKLKKVKDRCCI